MHQPGRNAAFCLSKMLNCSCKHTSTPHPERFSPSFLSKMHEKGAISATLIGFFLHFSSKCTGKRGQFLHFLLKITEKEGKPDLCGAS